MATKSKSQRRRAQERRAARKEERAQLRDGAAEETAVAVQEKPKEKPSPEKASEPPRLVSFAREVKMEMKRVTWPTREDVVQWTGVVIGALAFFGVYIALLDGGVTELLVAFTGLAG